MDRPLCQDCRYCRPTWGPFSIKFADWAPCRHPSSRAVKSEDSPVTGVTRRTQRLSCREARSEWSRDPGLCGPAGVFFTPRRLTARQVLRLGYAAVFGFWLGYAGLLLGIVDGINHLSLHRAPQQVNVTVTH